MAKESITVTENEQMTMETLQDNITNETDTHSFEAVSSAEYIDPDSIHFDKESEPINVAINRGDTFESESLHLGETIQAIANHSKQLEKSIKYVSRYAVVTGGDDGTEGIQLAYDKERSKQKSALLDHLFDLQKRPYEYRIDVNEGNSTKSYYLGTDSLDKIGAYRIYSYHDDKYAKLLRSTTQSTLASIELRRQFRINNSRLVTYRNLYIHNDDFNYEGITNPYLLQILQERRKDHRVQNIVASIQEEQDQIVHAPSSTSMIIQGCAGSGKTMIMMQRLSRLQNYLKTVNAYDVVIITPSDQYKIFMRALTEGLAIQRMLQNTIEQYYNWILSSYNKDFALKIDTLQPDTDGNLRYAQYIYSDRFKEILCDDLPNEFMKTRTCLEELISISSSLNIPTLTPADKVPDNQLWEEIQKISKLVSDRLHDRSEEIDQKTEQLNKSRIRIQDIERTSFLQASDALRFYREYAAEEALHLLRSEIERSALPSKLHDAVLHYSNIDLNSSTDKDLLEIVKLAELANIHISEETAHNLDESEQKLKNLRKEFDALLAKEKELEIEISGLNTNNWFTSLLSRFNELQDHIKEQSPLNIYRKLYQKTTDPILAEMDIKRSNRYHKYDLYARLLFCRSYYSKPLDLHSFICIDEGQDLSLNEYHLLKDLCGTRSIFNVYGDTHQTLHTEIGIHNWDELSVLLKARMYILEENYRNTNEIIRWCNREFKLKIREMGIKGPEVRTAALMYAIVYEFRHKGNSERWALIIPETMNNRNYYNQIKKSVSPNIVSLNKITNDAIALVHVQDIKGFEFEKVFCLSDGMAVNEKYVAYTRALQELVLVYQEKTNFSKKSTDTKTENSLQIGQVETGAVNKPTVVEIRPEELKIQDLFGEYRLRICAGYINLGQFQEYEMIIYTGKLKKISPKTGAHAAKFEYENIKNGKKRIVSFNYSHEARKIYIPREDYMHHSSVLDTVFHIS